ncbi:MAG: hypothetical protein BA864_04995 [Desulfuromonadales bacterium C00003093]|nr:MAG: hypothetical protein BA864_04995 [Desulfuromonadales bacterium C00003093]
MMIADLLQRDAAIDVTQSCIVQAPAGSGKTELLIQRFLALLGTVERPNQILAITFTRKAAGEMRQRLFLALNAAQHCPRPEKAHEAKTWDLAKQALQKQGDQLLNNPTQLAIQTIDSFNASLVRKMPWLSRFGALPELADDAEPLYLQAVEQLLRRLDTQGPGSGQLRLLLGHLDNQVSQLQRMLVDMLKRRDQWLRHLLKNDPDPRATLEAGLEKMVTGQLANLRSEYPPAFVAELLYCVRFAAANLDRSILQEFAELQQLPGSEAADLSLWQALAEFLLTGKNELRKSVNVKNGFPPGAENKETKQRMLELLRALVDSPEFVARLLAVRQLPGATYAENQWPILQCLVELLPMLVAELWLVFRGQGQADYAEIALKAKQALGAADNPTELLLRTDNDLQHILVDEFQDTSWLQYELLLILTAGWSDGDGRTLFLVGDPMQSIYRFREAEVGLFLRVFAGRLGEKGPRLKPLQLRCNFRSQEGIVSWVNRSFADIFPEQVDIASGAVPLAAATAVDPALPGPACCLHPFSGRDDQAEAEQVLHLVQQAGLEDPHQTIAILVRGRKHLQAILPLLRQHGLKYQARDIDPLGARPAVLDLVNLCKAVLHRADRLAWLSVLRAPWCGLSLNDLHALVGDLPKATIPSLLDDEQRMKQLSLPGRAAIARIWPLLQRAITRRGRLSLRTLIEGTWLALGGPACYDAEGIADAQLLFGLLESLEQGGDLSSFDLLEQGLNRLFAAPDVDADGKLQVMTIHKAKGLQFGTVILPGLGKSTGGADSPLLRWQEHPDYGLLLAPVAARGSGEKDPIYQLIGRLEKEKQDQEAARLLYVATTRAISRLHLIGHAKADKKGDLKPTSGSLLEKLWPLVEDDFAAHAVSCEATADEFESPLLRRLPVNWQGPLSTGVRLSQEDQLKTASVKEDIDGRELIFSGWESESRRHVGTLVHQYLERIARFGPEVWSRQSETEREKILGRQLSALGVPFSEVPGSTARVVAAVERTRNSERGKWLLSPHAEHDCELPLTGVVAGELIHAVIDRTFVADGRRWIVDYKTSSPKAGETEAAFLQREREHYRRQMSTYLQLMNNYDQRYPVRTALYFPLLDGWCELELDCAVR